MKQSAKGAIEHVRFGFITNLPNAAIEILLALGFYRFWGRLAGSGRFCLRALPRTPNRMRSLAPLR
jgi:hypothetical protein